MSNLNYIPKTLRFLLFVAALFVGVAAHAEQQIIMYVHEYPGSNAYINPPARVKVLLQQGWHIVRISVTGGAPYFVVYILERPQATKS